MTLPAPTYDLVMLLDSSAEESVHLRIVSEARTAIESGGELVGDHPWGDRLLTYPIDHRTAAKYHLLQFRAGGAELLERLDRTLRFADEVVRFRIVKLKPGTPPPAEMPSAAAAAPVPEAEAAPKGTVVAEGGVVAAPEAEITPEVEATPEAEAGGAAVPVPEAVPEAEAAAAPEAETVAAPEIEAAPDAQVAPAVEVAPEAQDAPEVGGEPA